MAAVDTSETDAEVEEDAGEQTSGAHVDGDWDARGASAELLSSRSRDDGMS